MALEISVWLQSIIYRLSLHFPLVIHSIQEQMNVKENLVRLVFGTFESFFSVIHEFKQHLGWFCRSYHVGIDFQIWIGIAKPRRLYLSPNFSCRSRSTIVRCVCKCVQVCALSVWVRLSRFVVIVVLAGNKVKDQSDAKSQTNKQTNKQKLP